MNKREHIAELNENAILLEEEFDEALVGVQERNSVFVPLYDIHKLIDIYIEKGLSGEDATDHVYTNIVNAYLGENTPAFYYSFME
ncbi:hypothetical protein CVD28_02815 [Bacillus sp. M6-12]|uniref:hypothetical protein n=1 Tax=Bacillus sp. M6-12 TaxID=2054166 RepID=UPI000C766AA9|nr:hypothetical protein [Bacillus sp. M6-12]PLS19364.1 hypothetical protein CVD28_02815 [Bacillus sp. M6-12]